MKWWMTKPEYYLMEKSGAFGEETKREAEELGEEYVMTITITFLVLMLVLMVYVVGYFLLKLVGIL